MSGTETAQVADPTEAAAAVEARIRELETIRYAAMRNGDIDTLAPLLAESLVYSHSNAERDTKASYLDKVTQGSYVYESVEHTTDAVLVSGTSAVAVGRMQAVVRVDGGAEPLRIDNASLAVWTRADGRWRLLAYQPTVRPR